MPRPKIFKMRYATSFAIEYDLYEKIKERAHKEKISLSELIRRALIQYINNK